MKPLLKLVLVFGFLFAGHAALAQEKAKPANIRSAKSIFLMAADSTSSKPEAKGQKRSATTKTLQVPDQKKDNSFRTDEAYKISPRDPAVRQRRELISPDNRGK